MASSLDIFVYIESQFTIEVTEENIKNIGISPFLELDIWIQYDHMSSSLDIYIYIYVCRVHSTYGCVNTGSWVDSTSIHIYSCMSSSLDIRLCRVIDYTWNLFGSNNNAVGIHAKTTSGNIRPRILVPLET